MKEDRSRKKERMYALLEEWKQSGKQQKDFCRDHDIPLYRFQYWRRKQKREAEATGGFFPVSCEDRSNNATMELIYPSGVRLCLPLGTPASKVRELVSLH